MLANTIKVTRRLYPSSSDEQGNQLELNLRPDAVPAQLTSLRYVTCFPKSGLLWFRTLASNLTTLLATSPQLENSTTSAVANAAYKGGCGVGASPKKYSALLKTTEVA